MIEPIICIRDVKVKKNRSVRQIINGIAFKTLGFTFFCYILIVTYFTM